MSIYFKTKILKQQNKLSATSLKYGWVGLQAEEAGLLSIKQFEALELILNRNASYPIKVISRLNFNIIHTKKSLGSRMGSGKGKEHSKVGKVLPGQVFIELLFPLSSTYLRSEENLLVVTSPILSALLPIKFKFKWHNINKNKITHEKYIK